MARVYFQSWPQHNLEKIFAAEYVLTEKARRAETCGKRTENKFPSPDRSDIQAERRKGWPSARIRMRHSGRAGNYFGPEYYKQVARPGT